jgi:hypothetical protein
MLHHLACSSGRECAAADLRWGTDGRRARAADRTRVQARRRASRVFIVYQSVITR